MHISCTDKELAIFNLVAEAARENHVQAFVIGGFVRDKVLGRPTKDADIVCTGDGISLAHSVADKLDPRPYVSYFKTFGTAHLKYEDLDISL